MTNYLETIEELKEFLKEHESELYADETKRCLYMNLCISRLNRVFLIRNNDLLPFPQTPRL